MGNWSQELLRRIVHSSFFLESAQSQLRGQHNKLSLYLIPYLPSSSPIIFNLQLDLVTNEHSQLISLDLYYQEYFHSPGNQEELEILTPSSP